MDPWYATREQVKAAPDLKHTARDNAMVDQAVDSATRKVEKTELRRRFWPHVATYTFRRPRGRILFFADAGLDVDLVQLDTLTVDGTTVVADDYDLLPVDGPPYNRIEFDETVVFGTDRRPVSMAGTWGHDDRTAPAGELAAAIGDTTTTAVDVSDSAKVGVGDLLTVDSERLVVTEKAMLDTGQNLQSPNLTASLSDDAVTVTDGSAYHRGEVLLLESERMLVVDIAGNSLKVKRAWDGTVLAAHSAGVDIFGPRRLTVQRGFGGTTAATHNQAAALVRQLYPAPVTALTVALAVVQILQETGGYAHDTGTGESPLENAGRGLRQARKDAGGYARLLIA